MAAGGVNSLDERILDQVFTTYWGQFEAKFKDVLKKYPPAEEPEPRSEQHLLAEIVENTRLLARCVRSHEARVDQRVDARKDPKDGREGRLLNPHHIAFIHDIVNAGANDSAIMEHLGRLGMDLASAYNVVRAIRGNADTAEAPQP
jgi:hypothetical protein